MNLALWILQGLLAFAYVGAGAMKTARSKAALVADPRMGWAADYTEGQIKLIGLAEIAGGIGLVAPWATHILPVLTPVAAACLVAIMLGAARAHLQRKEPSAAPLVLAVLSAVVAVGRFLPS